MTGLYGIAEWFGEPFARMPPARRRRLAQHALGLAEKPPPCPFVRGRPPCAKRGGVCSIQRSETGSGRGIGLPVITCPHRFSEADLLPLWLAEVVGFDDPHLGTEVPFMRSPQTGREAGRIDMVLARDARASAWYGLEIQAVYFSGPGMQSEFERLLADTGERPPDPTARRRPDWRSSGAKRLAPQLQVKVPTLRRWGTKLAVAVDLPFFEAVGGRSAAPSHDLDDGDIIWLVPRVSKNFRLEAAHWEVLSLEESTDKLLAAQTVKRREFENVLRNKLRPLSGERGGLFPTHDP